MTVTALGLGAGQLGDPSIDHLRHNVRIAERGPLPNEIITAITTRFQELGADWPGEI